MADRRLLRLIQKWLKAGVSEDGQWSQTKKGTPQGAVVSPLVANIYLHYVFDLWVHAWRRKVARGAVVVVRYADDLVVGFQYRHDAERFGQELADRLAKFGLELNVDKTRLVEFGRWAERDRRRRGEGKPETFDFLGFTHYCGKHRKGYFCVWRKTTRKRLVAKLKQIKQQLRVRRHENYESMEKRTGKPRARRTLNGGSIDRMLRWLLVQSAVAATRYDHSFLSLDNAGNPTVRVRSETRRSYVYRIDGDTFAEGHGLLIDDGRSPALVIWNRVKEK